MACSLARRSALRHQGNFSASRRPLRVSCVASRVGLGGGRMMEQRRQDTGSMRQVQLMWKVAPSKPAQPQEADGRLTAEIKGAQSWQHLWVIYQRESGRMNHIHMSAMVTHVAQLAQRPHSSAPAEPAHAPDASMQQVEAPMQQDMERIQSSMAASTSRPSVKQMLARSRASPRAQSAQQQQSASSQTRPGTPAAPSNDSAGSTEASILLDAVLQEMLGVMHRLQPRQLANCLWALAKLRYTPSASWLSRCLAAAQRQLDAFEPQHLANTAYALALRPEWLEQVQGRGQLLDKLYSAAQSKLSAFKPQELSNLLWAAAQMHFTRPLNPGGACARCVFMAAQAARARVSELRNQEVVNILWAVAHLSGQPGLVGRQQEQPTLSSLQAQGVQGSKGSSVTRARPAPSSGSSQMARQVHPAPNVQPLMPAPSSAWLGVMLRRVHDTRADLTPSGMSSLLLSLGWLGARPQRAWVRALLQDTAPLLRSAGPGELSGMSLGLAYLGYAPTREWSAQWWAAFSAQLPQVTPQALANGCWAMSRLHQRTSNRVAARLLLAAAQRMGAFSAGELAQLLPSLAAFRCRPDAAWLELLCAASYDVVGGMGPREAVVLLGALARHNHRPPRAWVARVLEHTHHLLPSMPGNTLAVLLRSLAALGLPLPRAWVVTYMAAAQDRMGELGPRDVANMLWALAMLDVRPSAAWMREAVGRSAALLRMQREAAAEASSSGDDAEQLYQGDVVPAEQKLVWQERLTGDQLPGTAARGGRVRDRTRLAKQLATWDTVSLTQCIWALGRMGYGPGHAFMSAFSDSLREMGEHDASSVATTTDMAHSPQPAHTAAPDTTSPPPASTALAASLMNRRPTAWLQQRSVSDTASDSPSFDAAAQAVAGAGQSVPAGSTSSSSIALVVLQGLAQWASARLGYAPLAQAAAAPGAKHRKDRSNSS